MSKIISNISKIGLGTASSMLLSLVINKLIAVLYGPNGVGAFSLIKQIITTSSFLGLGSQTVVVQGISSRKDNDRVLFFKASLFVYAVGACISSFFLGLSLIYKPSILPLSLMNISGLTIFIVCLSVIFNSIYFCFKSVLNGMQNIKELLLVEIVGPAVLILFFTSFYLFIKEDLNFWFALGFLLSQSSMLMFSFFFLMKKVNFLNVSAEFFISKNLIFSFISVSFLSVAAALVGSGALMGIRFYTASISGLSSAGYFESAWTISNAYLAILVNTFSVYYLPVLSSKNHVDDQRDLVVKIFRLVIVFTSLLICIVIPFKVSLIGLLYADKFRPAEYLCRWMMIGDYFKMSAWVLALISISKGRVLTYFFTEFFWWTAFLFFSAYFLRLDNDLEKIGVVYLFLYVFLFLFYVIQVFFSHNIKFLFRDWFLWFVGMLSILCVSWFSWISASQNFFLVVFSIFAMLVIFYCISLKSEKEIILKYFNFH